MDPTSRGDEIAARMRVYYEAHRETWWERYWRRWEYTADNLMLGLANTYQQADRELPTSNKETAGAADDR